MFFDIGPLELVVLIILAVIIFGPEKLPKLIQDVAHFIRKVREFSDSAKEDIRSELGPEFKDFEFEDLNPKNFARKHLLSNDDLGIKEIRDSFDFRSEMAGITDALNGVDSDAVARTGDDEVTEPSDRPRPRVPLSKGDPLSKDTPAAPKESPPFDADAT